MSPITHGLISWCVANALPRATRRQRVLITCGGLIPDTDGLGAPVDVFTRTFTDHPTGLFQDYHHLLHCGAYAAVATAFLTAFARAGTRAVTAGMALLTFHLHLLCDVVGARGPDGNTWGIPYFLPFSDYVPLEVSWQWELNAWPNFLVTFLCLGFAFWAGVKRGRTFVEVFSQRADAAVVGALRRRFGSPAPAVEGDGQEEGVLGVEAGVPAPGEQGREEEQEDVERPRPAAGEAD